jgi:long-chain fatty acid transport protein
MKKIVLISLVASSVLMAGGYKIPESSTNAVALGAANIAHNHSADAAYYNPANMVFMADEHQMEVDLTYIGLDGTKFTPVTGTAISAQKENFIVPTLHYVSKKLGNARVGLSIVSPVGLSKRWSDAPANASAEEFTLKTIEVNPTAAFEVNSQVAVAVGFRAVHSSGVVKATPLAGVVSQDMTGDSLDFGYNLALAYKPTSDIEIGLTYRSKIDLTVEGSADLQHPGFTNGNYAVAVTVPLPAAFAAAIAYTLPTDTTIELVYEKTYWSAYKEIDFNYTNSTVEAVFGGVNPKNWKDTNTFRLGITQELDALTLMAGVVIDESPAPDATLGFELPDSDSTAVSFGGRYKINDKIDIGLATLYSMRKDRTVNNASLNGTFTNSNVLLVSAGIGYKF